MKKLTAQAIANFESEKTVVENCRVLSSLVLTNSYGTRRYVDGGYWNIAYHCAANDIVKAEIVVNEKAVATLVA